MRAALRRAATSYRIFILAALLLTVGTVGGTLAEFNGETTHTATVAGGWVAAPTGLQAPVVRGNGATLTWTAGTHGVASQSILGTDFGTTNPGNCSTATYATSFLTGLAANAGTANPDRGSGSGGDAGNWICYQVVGIHGSWTTSANFSGPLQVGLVPTGLTITSGSSAGQASNNDTITLSFNQAVTWTGGTGTFHVCAYQNPGNDIIIGDAAGCPSSAGTGTIGKISGLSIPGSGVDFDQSTAAASGNTIVITIVSSANGSHNRTTVTGSGTFAYTGNATIIQSSAGAAGVCTAANCTWTTSGGF